MHELMNRPNSNLRLREVKSQNCVSIYTKLYQHRSDRKCIQFFGSTLYSTFAVGRRHNDVRYRGLTMDERHWH